MTVVATLSSATCHSAAHSGSTRGTPAVFTTASWTTRELRMWWASHGLRAPSSYPMRTHKASPLGNTSIWVINGLSTPFAAEKNGSSYVQYFGTDGSDHWNRPTAPHGMQSSRRDDWHYKIWKGHCIFSMQTRPCRQGRTTKCRTGLQAIFLRRHQSLMVGYIALMLLDWWRVVVWSGRRSLGSAICPALSTATRITATLGGSCSCLRS